MDLQAQIEGFRQQAEGFRRELVHGGSQRFAGLIAAPNLQREIIDKRRAGHHVNIVSTSSTAQTLVTGVAGNSYTLVGSIPTGFELDHVVIDAYDARFYGLIGISIEGYESNQGKGIEKNFAGPLSLFEPTLRREMSMLPPKIAGKQAKNDFSINVKIWCWETPTGPFHGFGLVGTNHNSDCPLGGRVEPTKAFRILQQLGPSSVGTVKGLISAIGGQARGLTHALTNG